MNIQATAVATNGHAPVDDEIARIVLGYEEAKRRDTLVEHEKWHWKLGALAGWSVAVLFCAVACWLFLSRATLQAFVHVVQVDDAGKVVSMGVPVSLLDYTPQEGQWLDMIAEWITAVRWRGNDVTLLQDQWRTAYLRTCGEARRLLQYVEETEKPFVLGKRRVAVRLQSITKTPSPLSYQALWEEIVTDSSQQPQVQRYAGTFTIGRMKPRDQAAMLRNRLGLCIAGFDISMQPERK